MELKSQEQLRTELSAPLPKEAIKAHPTKTYLSSIKAIYVTERLNSVFGIGKWSLKVTEIERGDKGMIVVKATMEIPDYGMYYESYGGNDNGGEASKNFDLGDAYKGATTDAITKICSYLEIGIDVFKGLVMPPAANTPKDPNAPELPWLNEKDTANWNDAISTLRAGSIADVRLKYKVSKEVLPKLESASKSAIQVPEPSVADKAAQMGKQTIALTQKELDAYKLQIDAITAPTGLTGFYNGLTADIQSNPSIIQWLKDKRESFKTPA